MEKRRNTLDRFQLLPFGRKSTPAAAPEAAASAQADARTSGSDKHRKTFERSERLKELTELLRGSNMSRASSTPTPPPVPPPRRPRLLQTGSGASSIEVHDSPVATSADDQCLSPEEPQSKTSTSQLPKQNSNGSRPQQHGNNSSSSGGGSGSISVPTSSTASRLFHSMRPNASFSNLEAFMLGNCEKSKSSPPLAAGEELDPSSSEWATQLSRPESRIGSSPSAQKARLPFRSLSFTQIDCKSTLSAWRDRLRRDKAIEPPTLTHNKAVDQYRVENSEPGWIHIPLRSTALSINLNYGQEKSLENVLEDVSESITEDDIFNTDSNNAGSGAVPATASSVIAAHAKMESLSDTIHSEGEEYALPLTVRANNPPIIVEPESPSTPSTPNLVTLLEEPQTPESLATPTADSVLQTATTCLIPVPVYECASQEWLETPAQEWVELSPEFGIIPETTQPPTPHAACQISQTEMLTTALCGDSLPIISVSRSVEEGDEPESGTASPETESIPSRYNLDADQQAGQPYSPDDAGAELRSSSKMATPRHSTGERQKRYLDKSTKRKGMYIDSSDWHQRVDSHRGLALDMSMGSFEDVKPDSPDDAKAYASSPVMFDLNTPELEKASLSWSSSHDKPQLLSSFSCQSSEEKDDVSTGNNNNNSNNSKSNSFLQTDSLSDTEERVSWSPTPSGDYDHKRYSKRPLTVRGPYGQMLEAELKRPNRMHFEEIMEEMRDGNADSPHMRREHAAKSAAGSSRINMPQYSNSVRVRKSNAYLPVPSHTRAASTPSQIEHVSKGSLSPLPISVSAKDLNEVADKHQMKRAASEAPVSKPTHSKRSQSISSESKSQHLHQHHHGNHHHHHHGSKRSPDASKAGGSSSNKSDVAPTAALLAELLKGSSENMLSEQRQKTIAVS
ncbi:hypothetical protein KR222_002998, partial [Zaprionus bogoriensis]